MSKVLMFHRRLPIKLNYYALKVHSSSVASDIDITQKLGANAKNDYRTKLLVYLASRLKWDSPQDGQYLTISKQYLFKNLDLLGSNSSRNNQIFWRTVEELRNEGYILGAQELSGKRRAIEFQINPQKLRLRQS